MMHLEQVRVMVKKLYQRPASRELPADTCFPVQKLFKFCGMQRFENKKKLMVMEMGILEDNTQEVFVRVRVVVLL